MKKLAERESDVSNNIAANNESYKQLTHEIMQLETEIDSRLTGDVVFHEYKETQLRREALIIELILLSIYGKLNNTDISGEFDWK